MQNKILYGTNYSQILTDADIFGSVTYTNSINAGTDWQPGVASCACLQFASKHEFTIGTSIKWQVKMMDDASFVQKGIFNIKERKRRKDTFYYTCYDNMIKLEETDISSAWNNWWSGNQTKTLSNLYNLICTTAGVIAGSVSFTNSNYTLDKKRFYCNNVTARQLLSNIAEVAGGYAYANSSGEICISNLGTTSQHTFTSTEYKSVEVGSDPINVITGVWSGGTSDDVGILSGTATNVLKITGNPLLYNDGPNTTPTTQYNRVVTALGNILDVVPVIHKALNIQLFKDYNLNIGDKLQVTDAEGTHTSFIFSKIIKPSGVEFSCTGNTYRNKYISPLSNISGISTSVASIKIDNDQIKSEVSDLSGNVTTLTQNVSGLNTRVTNAEGNISSIDQKVDSIDLSVTNSGTSSHFILTADGATLSAGDITMYGKVDTSDLTDGNIALTIGGTGASGQLLIKDSSNVTRVNLNAGTNTYKIGGWTIDSNSIDSNTYSNTGYKLILNDNGTIEYYNSTTGDVGIITPVINSNNQLEFAFNKGLFISDGVNVRIGTGASGATASHLYLNGTEITSSGGGGEPAAYLKSISEISITGGKKFTILDKNNNPTYINEPSTYLYDASISGNNLIISKNGGQTLTYSGGMNNPMTTAGDIIYATSGGTPTRLPTGSAGQVLTLGTGGTQLPQWSYPQVIKKNGSSSPPPANNYDVWADTSDYSLKISDGTNWHNTSSFPYTILTGSVMASDEDTWTYISSAIQGKEPHYELVKYTTIPYSTGMPNVIHAQYCMITPNSPMLASYYKCYATYLYHAPTDTNMHYKIYIYADKAFETDDSITFNIMAFMPNS